MPSAMKDTEDTVLAEQVIASVSIMLDLIVSIYQVISQVTIQNQETSVWIVKIVRRVVPNEGHLWIAFQYELVQRVQNDLWWSKFK